jgi:hypothetical protein
MKKQRPVFYAGNFTGLANPIPLRISASSTTDLDALRHLAFTKPEEFARRFFLDILAPAVKKYAKKLPKDYHEKVNYQCMKILSALLFLHFKQKKSRNPELQTIRKMRSIYPEKKDVFDTSDNDDKLSSAAQRFRAGYIADGKNILRRIRQNDNPVLLNQLMRILEDRKVQTGKNQKDDELSFAYNLAAVAYEKLVDAKQWGELHPSVKNKLTEEYAKLLSVSESMFSPLKS